MLNAYINPNFSFHFFPALTIWIIQINRLLYCLLLGKGKVRCDLKLLVSVFVGRPEKLKLPCLIFILWWDCCLLWRPIYLIQFDHSFQGAEGETWSAKSCWRHRWHRFTRLSTFSFLHSILHKWNYHYELLQLELLKILLIFYYVIPCYYYCIKRFLEDYSF